MLGERQVLKGLIIGAICWFLVEAGMPVTN